MRTIIPCAGFGTRLGMRPEQSKEMLFYGKDRLIDLALAVGENPLVISRPNKKDLNEYISYCEPGPNEQPRAQLLLRKGDVSGEWPRTVLASQKYWGENNLLLLPDTIWESRRETIARAQDHLEAGSDIVFGIHVVTNPSQWGIISEWVLREKPTAMEGPKMAWGFIGFKKHIGERLFEAMADKRPFDLPRNVSFIAINGFKDLTRSWADMNLQREADASISR